MYDGVGEQEGTLSWELRHLNGHTLQSGSKPVELRYGQSVNQQNLDFADAMVEYGAGNLYVRAWLQIGEAVVSRQTAFLTALRFLNLPKAEVQCSLELTEGGREIKAVFTSPVFQTQVQFNLSGVKYRASDNFFDLYPNEPHTVWIQVDEVGEMEAVAKSLAVMSLVDSYE